MVEPTLGLINSATNPATNSLKANETNTKAAGDKQKLAKDFDEFMLLLTTQLQNQDPTEPMDTNQFTQQLVQFTTVEQSVATNENLEKLISLTSNNQINGAVSFIGKTIETKGSQGFLENSQAEFAYDVPEGAATVTLAVLDAKGNPVYSTSGPNYAGRQSFVWDGMNSFTKKPMADGIYSFGVSVKDREGKTLNSQTYTTGKVTGVALDGEEMILNMGNAFDVPLSNVVSVRDSNIAAPTPTTPAKPATDQAA